MEVCRVVVVETPSGVCTASSTSLDGVAVRVGSKLLNGVVVMTRPPPECMLTKVTKVRCIKRTAYAVERLTHNVVVAISRGNATERFVYPIKVWDAVSDMVRRFVDGKGAQQGIILYGPPGTGKTSLAKIIAMTLGFPVIDIRPYDIMSKWLGETERNLYAKLREAEINEPSVVIIDDCEWLFLSRELRSKETTTTVFLSTANIVLEHIEKWFNERRRIFVVATTNASLELLDKALIRSGRLGKPIHVPLPDYESVKEFLVREGIPEEEADRWAVAAVNMGLSMADVKLELLDRLREGKEPSIDPRSEAGYIRFFFVPPKEHEKEVLVYLRHLDPLGDFAEVVKERSRRNLRTAIWFAGPENVALAVANAFITYYAKIPAITLLSPRFLFDAVDAANTVGGFVVVPLSVLRSSPSDPTILRMALCTAYVGEGPAPDALRLDVLRGLSEVRDRATVERGLTYIVLSFYGIRYTDELAGKLIAIARSRGLESYSRLLDTLGYYGTRPEHIEYVLR